MKPSGLSWAVDQPTVFLFAHYDDGALNASGMMVRSPDQSLDLVVFSGLPTRLVTSLHRSRAIATIERSKPYGTVVHAFGRPVFGEWDRQCGLDEGPADVIAVRQAEHAHSCRVLGLQSDGLGVVDFQYSRRRRTPVKTAVARTVELLRSHDAATLVTHPLTAAHPDHVTALRIAQAAARETGVRLLGACERPYASCSSDSCGTRRAHPGMPSVTVELDDEQWAAKHAAVMAYRTQLDSLSVTFGDEWMMRERLGVECYHDITPSR